MSSSAPIFDDKRQVRGQLDLSDVGWKPVGRAASPGEHVELAFVAHTDGVTYVAMRNSAHPEGPVLVFTPSEWDAFLAGVKDGEFDDRW